MNSVFIDTSYLLALELSNDQNHVAAGRHWGQVTKALPRLVTICLLKFSRSLIVVVTTLKLWKLGTTSSAAPLSRWFMWMKTCFTMAGITSLSTRIKTTRSPIASRLL
jgi:hypothetical protein